MKNDIKHNNKIQNHRDVVKHVLKSISHNLVVVLGNISVGKTSIIKRVLGKPFGDMEATVGVEFSEYEVKNIENKVNLSLQVWDTCNV